MRWKVVLLVLIYFSSCATSQVNENDLIKYPWIPTKLNWNEGSFETYYFYNDSSFVKIASTQALIDKDSISFMSEPGFILYSGKYNLINGTNEIVLNYRLLYRTFRLTDEKLPGHNINERISLTTIGGDKLIESGGTSYIKTKKFTSESILKLNDVIEKFLPSLSD